jgi:hypothetical protein
VRAALLALAACVSGCDGTTAGTDAGADTGAGAEVPYAQVEAIIRRSCAYERCHGGALIGAGLDLARGRDYRAALLDRPACEYERMALVEPGEPERSWLMVKLTAPYRGLDDPYALYIEFEPAADWDPSQRACPDQTDDGAPLFGQRMPLTAPNMLPDEDLAAIRSWIEAGAPP